MQKRTNVSKKPKKENNPVSSDLPNILSSTTNKRKSISKTVVPSAKKRRRAEDESTPVMKPPIESASSLRRSARLMGDRPPLSPLKSTPRIVRGRTSKNTVGSEKIPDQNSARRNASMKIKPATVPKTSKVGRPRRDVRIESTPVMKTSMKPSKSSLRRSSRLISDRFSPSPINTPRTKRGKGFRNTIRNENKTPTRSYLKRSPSMKNKQGNSVFEAASSAKRRRDDVGDEPTSSRRPTTLLDDEPPPLLLPLKSPRIAHEEVPENPDDSSREIISDPVPMELAPRDVEPTPVRRPFNVNPKVGAGSDDRRSQVQDIQTGVDRNSQNIDITTTVSDVNLQESSEQETHQSSNITVNPNIYPSTTDEIHRHDTILADERTADDQNENESDPEDGKIHLEAVDEQNSDQLHTAAPENNDERNPEDEGDQFNSRDIFSMTEEEFMKATELVPYGPQVIAHFVTYNFDDRYELIPEVHFASSLDDWEKFKNGTDDRERGRIINGRDDDDDLEIVHEAIKKKVPSVSVNQRLSMGNAARFSCSASLRSQGPANGYPSATHHAIPNYSVSIRHLRPVNTFQVSVPEGFRPYEPPRGELRHITVNNSRWRTRSRTVTEVGISPHEHRRAMEFPEVNVTRTTDIGPRRSAVDCNSRRTYDGRNFQRDNSGFPLNQPGFPVHARAHVMEPSSPVLTSNFRISVSPGSSSPVRRPPRMTMTVNGLSNFSIRSRETPYRQYAPRDDFVQIPPVQNRNIFVEENPHRTYRFTSDNTQNSNF